MKPEYAEVLRWIADGKEVQYKDICWSEWCEIKPVSAVELVAVSARREKTGAEPLYEFRLKPEKKWFRVYLGPHGLTHTLDSCEGAAEAATSEHSHFVRWLTDRIYYE
jgi:hypothetical protein